MKFLSFKSTRLLKVWVLSFFILMQLSCSSDDGTPSEPVAENPDPSINPTEPLPSLVINTNGATIVDEPKVNATLQITDNEVVDFEGAIAIEFRGASSQALFPKKSYGFETRDASNADLDTSLLGLPEEEDWILHGPYSDKSLMRNLFIYDLSRSIGMYASRAQFVELNVNGVYQGVYLLMEKLKRDKNRIDIAKLKEDENTGEDLTGGYVLKIDKLSASDPGGGAYTPQNSFESEYLPPVGNIGQEIHFLYEYPDAEEITTEQKAYIADYINNFEDALASDDFTDPNTGYAAYIDVDSFIDFFLLTELSNNVDGYRLSTYLNKDKNEKLKMGPIWDFNLAFGNADYCSGGATNVWAYKFNERCSNDIWLVPFWWDRLLQDPAFVARLQDRWNSLRGSSFSDTAISEQLNGYVQSLEDAAVLDSNFQKWPVLGTYIWPNNFVGSSYSDEVDYLQTWLADRLSWLDNEIDGL